VSFCYKTMELSKDVRYIAFCAFVAAVSIAWTRQIKRTVTGKAKPNTKVNVGVGVVVYKESSGEVLLGLRKNAHGANTWALPGGWLERGEDFVACALREVEEETGLTKSDLGEATVIEVAPSNNVFSELHSVSVFVKVPLLAKKEPRVTEPDKCERWEWFPSRTKQWPSAMFHPAKYLFHVKHLSL
jgi:8-oxo-dGTP diphosphatase